MDRYGLGCPTPNPRPLALWTWVKAVGPARTFPGFFLFLQSLPRHSPPWCPRAIWVTGLGSGSRALTPHQLSSSGAHCGTLANSSSAVALLRVIMELLLVRGAVTPTCPLSVLSGFRSWVRTGLVGSFAEWPQWCPCPGACSLCCPHVDPHPTSAAVTGFRLGPSLLALLYPSMLCRNSPSFHLW